VGHFSPPKTENRCTQLVATQSESSRECDTSCRAGIRLGPDRTIANGSTAAPRRRSDDATPSGLRGDDIYVHRQNDHGTTTARCTTLPQHPRDTQLDPLAIAVS
jgi:hypothetical protein